MRIVFDDEHDAVVRSQEFAVVLDRFGHVLGRPHRCRRAGGGRRVRADRG